MASPIFTARVSIHKPSGDFKTDKKRLSKAHSYTTKATKLLTIFYKQFSDEFNFRQFKTKKVNIHILLSDRAFTRNKTEIYVCDYYKGQIIPKEIVLQVLFHEMIHFILQSFSGQIKKNETREKHNKEFIKTHDEFIKFVRKRGIRIDSVPCSYCGLSSCE
jgi:hypothetical protein